MPHTKIESILNDVTQLRDELQLKAHLAKAEAKDGLKELDAKYESLKANTKKIASVAGDSASEVATAVGLGIDAKSKEDVYTSLELASDELKKGYEKIKKIL